MKILNKIATVADIPLIQQLAHDIWYEYYPNVIPMAQIEYMLKKMYSESQLRADMQQQHFTLFESQQQSVGFIALNILSDQLFLEKVYLKVAYHGQGFGQYMLQYAEQFAQSHDLGGLSLRVNKYNMPAINAYERAGFEKIKASYTDIGEGFFMDDYLMQKNLG